MIAWSIEAAQAADLFDRVIVSTDDSEIAEVAMLYGADVPFIRSPELSNDYTATTPVIAHAVQWAYSQGWRLDVVCCIYATAPFLTADDIKLGWTTLNSGDWEFVFSVTDFAAPIFRAFKLNEENGIEMFFPEYFETRSQDLPNALHDAGQFYWGRPTAWLECKRIFDRHSTAVVIPRWRAIDIDTQEDWCRAEIMASVIMKNM